VYIAFGMVMKERVESILYNTAVLVGPDGELVGTYNKMHLHGEERMAFREGFRLPVFETDIGVIGLMIGWDLAFPEVARSLTLDGAELLCVLANWEASAIDEWRTYVKARAYENATFVAAANRVGEDVTLTFGGESMIVGPRGKIHATVPNEPVEKPAAEKADEQDAEKPEKAEPEEKPREGYAVARIDLDEIRRQREENQTLQTRQPAAYRTLVKKY